MAAKREGVHRYPTKKNTEKMARPSATRRGIRQRDDCSSSKSWEEPISESGRSAFLSSSRLGPCASIEACRVVWGFMVGNSTLFTKLLQLVNERGCGGRMLDGYLRTAVSVLDYVMH